MADTRFDVVGLGSAIVDILSHTSDEQLSNLKLTKGSMRLIDESQASFLYENMGPAVECSGGSAANTIAGLAAMGGAAAFIGKIRDDQLGRVFAHDIRAAGVAYSTEPLTDGAATAMCLVFVTPDAQRTMGTYLGAATALSPTDVDPALPAAAKVTYSEAYLWDTPNGRAAIRQAFETAKTAGRKIAFSLSDPFCVDRHRDDFLALIEGDVDILFANEVEIRSLYQVDDFDAAVQKVRGHCAIAALTRSEKGSVVLGNGEVHVIDAAPVARVVDTTGAGDLYAAGFLYALCRGRDLGECGRAGGIAAAAVIQHFGARPEADLAALLAPYGG